MYNNYNSTQAGSIVGKTSNGQPVVAEKGDGSLESGRALKDENPTENRHAAKGDQRTTFHADQSDNPQKYKRLWKHQHGYHSDDNGKRSYADKLHMAESLCDSLELSDTLKDDVKRLVGKVDGRAFNKLGGLEAVCLGVIAVCQNRTIDTVDEYENRIQQRYICDYKGDRKYCHDQPRFQYLAEKYGVDWQKAMRKVKEQT